MSTPHGPDDSLARQAMTEALIAREQIKSVAEAATIRETMSTRAFTALEAKVEDIPQAIKAAADRSEKAVDRVWAFIEKLGFLLLGILIASTLNLIGTIFVMVTKT